MNNQILLLEKLQEINFLKFIIYRKLTRYTRAEEYLKSKMDSMESSYEDDLNLQIINCVNEIGPIIQFLIDNKINHFDEEFYIEIKELIKDVGKGLKITINRFKNLVDILEEYKKINFIKN